MAEGQIITIQFNCNEKIGNALEIIASKTLGFYPLSGNEEIIKLLKDIRDFEVNCYHYEIKESWRNLKLVPGAPLTEFDFGGYLVECLKDFWINLIKHITNTIVITSQDTPKTYRDTWELTKGNKGVTISKATKYFPSSNLPNEITIEGKAIDLNRPFPDMFSLETNKWRF